MQAQKTADQNDKETKRKILIVEDNPASLYLVTFILQNSGYRVMAAENGAKGVKLGLTEKPMLILMDLQLPDFDGLEATRQIRENDAGRWIPIIALTSYAMPGDRERALAAGCNGYIKKPINPETFVRDVEHFVTPFPDETMVTR